MSTAAKFKPPKNGHATQLSIMPSSSATLAFEDIVLEVEIVRVTPAMAAEWLKRNTRNRPLRKKALARYAAIMKANRWVLNGETIVFGQNGDLLNGQHRLNSCVESGMSFVTIVVRGGIDRQDAFATFDQNAIRTAGDCLAMEGDKNCGDLAAALTLYWRHIHNRHCQISLYLDKPDLIAFRGQHPLMQESVTYAQAFKMLTSRSVVAFCHYAFSMQDPDRSEQFFEGLRNGSNLKENSPILRLRNLLIKERGGKKRRDVHELIALFFKAWVAYRDNMPMRSLQWRSRGDNPEPFPSID